ncbi:hypothetical protein Nepgr_004381 [Nepenthes gracilis]|uniref:(S)-ureidoglycine aminohydrolase cupin domain-containing protein n=1 Tax=Nepenthes gracilis TaxID=150966 RepID=A0AAD3S1E1_NEPGR|nr:hypothetical protein Nepgr_004381 [Nepenthes gracilis]
MAAEPKSDSTANLRITVERNPSESRLSELGIKSWPKWGCSPGKYQLKFEERETCYLVKGKVRAYPRGGASAAVAAPSSSSDDGYVEFGAGDLVIIPKGLSCTWDVSLPVDKYYKFDASSPSSSPPPPFC